MERLITMLTAAIGLLLALIVIGWVLKFLLFIGLALLQFLLGVLLLLFVAGLIITALRRIGRRR